MNERISASRASEGLLPRALISLLLALVLAITLIPVQAMTAFAGDRIAVALMRNGAPVTALAISETQGATISALADPAGDYGYQWQLRIPGSDEWVSVEGATAADLEVTSSLVEGALDAAGTASLRCVVTDSATTALSDPVTVVVSQSPASRAVASATPAAAPLAVPNLEEAPLRAAAAGSIDLQVNYLDSTTKTALYDPYVEEGLQPGQTLADIVSPTVLGYAPVYNAADPSSDSPAAAADDAESITVSIPQDQTSSPYVVNVYYKPTMVSYAIKYYFQNVGDDGYTEQANLQVTKQILAGSYVGDAQLALNDPDGSLTKGFSMVGNYPQQVAADGSSVYRCYYNRDYHLLQFDLDGGRGVAPLYAKYGSTLAVPNPTRPGWTFDGWYLKGDSTRTTVAAPTRMPSENREYVAKWKPGNTSYTIAYWWQNANDDDYSSVGSVKVEAESGRVVSGSDTFKTATDANGNLLIKSVALNFKHDSSVNETEGFKSNFVYNAARTDKNVTVKGDGSTIVNVYYDRKVYTMRFFYAREYAEAKNASANKPTSTVVNYAVPYTTDFFGKGAGEPTSPLADTLKAGDTYFKQIKALPQLSNPGSYSFGSFAGGTFQDGATDDPNGNGGYTTGGMRYHFFSFTARYGQDISQLWPGADTFTSIPRTSTRAVPNSNFAAGQWQNEVYLGGWNPRKGTKYLSANANPTIKGSYLVLDDNLLSASYASDTSFLGFYENLDGATWNYPRDWTYRIWVEPLPGQSTAGLQTATYNGKTYILNPNGPSEIKAFDNNDNNASQTPPTISGFTLAGSNGPTSTKSGGEDGMPSRVGNFFYDRNTYTVSVYNTALTDPGVPLTFQDAYGLPQKNGEPGKSLPNAEDMHVPSYLENAQARTFGGWYYTANFLPGSEVGDADTVPPRNVSIYAKWDYVSYRVRLYETEQELEKAKQGLPDALEPLYEFPAVTYGTTIPTEVPDPELDGRQFVGWFYRNADGVKVAFNPDDTPITANIDLFAEWTSTESDPYGVYYVLDQDETEEAWLSALRAAAEGAPKFNHSYEATVNGETRGYVYLNDWSDTAGGSFHRKVAKDTLGFAAYGSSNTFYPRVGDSSEGLYPEFAEHYFPTSRSQNLQIERETDPLDPEVNVAVFTYAYQASVPYRVEYRKASDDSLMDDGSVERSTTASTVTENAKDYPGYLPDRPSGNLTISVTRRADGSYASDPSNLVVFRYSEDSTRAYYTVRYLFQRLSTTEQDVASDSINTAAYEETVEPSIELADIGSTANVSPRAFSGFTIKAARIKDASGEYTVVPTQNPDGSYQLPVAASGSEISLYYTRDTMSYRVFYLRYGTDVSSPEKLAAIESAEVGQAGKLAVVRYVDANTPIGPFPGRDKHIHFGDPVTENAIDIAGYNCVSARSLTVEMSSEYNNNVFVFYYMPNKYTVQYQAWVRGGGITSRGSETVIEASFAGARPVPYEGYEFKGWYLDAACTQPAVTGSADDKATVEAGTNRLIPNKAKIAVAPASTRFYAKFTPIVGSLTIARSATLDQSNGSRVHYYRITRHGSTDDPIVVAVPAGESRTINNLKVGRYDVEQMNDWSWRYSDPAYDDSSTEQAAVTVSQGGASVVRFTKAPGVEWSNPDTKWLSGSSSLKSVRKTR